MQKIIYAVWVRFTPYMVEWLQREYGTGLVLSGKHVLELRPSGEIKRVLRTTVNEDLEMSINEPNTMSQFRYEMIHATVDLDPIYAEKRFGFTAEELGCFLPVHVPEYMLTADGILRPFSRYMQLRGRTAELVNNIAYQAFWQVVHEYSLTHTDCRNDKQMLEDFCMDNEITDVYVDELRNLYQRMKRRGRFVNIC